MKSYHQIIVLLLFVSISTTAYGTKYTATKSGNWTTPATWSPNGIPGAGDEVSIQSYTITLDSKVTIDKITLSNELGNNNAYLNILSDTLTVLGNIEITAFNEMKDVVLMINGNSTVNVLGDVNITRNSDNDAANKLLFQMGGSSKTMISGDLLFDYKDSNDGEEDLEIQTIDSAQLEVIGTTTIISSWGKNLDISFEGNSIITLRDSLTIKNTGGGNTTVLTKGASQLNILSNVSIENTSFLGFPNSTLEVEDTSKVSISGDLNLKSTFFRKTELNLLGTNSEVSIGGNISMSAISSNDAIINLKNGSKLFLGGSIDRPNKFGSLDMDEVSDFYFNGTQPQEVPSSKIDNAGTDSLLFKKTHFANTSGVPITLDGDIVIQDTLFLSTSKIKTSSTGVVVIEDNAVISGANENAYIQGPILKKGRTNNQAFVFPTGDSVTYAPIEISAVSLVDSEFKAEFFSDPPPFGNQLVESEVQEMVQDRYWKLTREAGSPDVHVSIHWDTDQASGITKTKDLIVTGLKSDSTWTSYGNGGITLNPSSGQAGSVQSLESDPPPFGVILFTLGTSTAKNALPVELTKFQAIQKNEEVHLQWETASESNTSEYIIERSSDGINFEYIGEVLSGGDSNYTQFYNFTDKTPIDGINYYRLKIVDADFTFEYSHIEVVNFDRDSELKIFPNPVKELLQIEGNFDDFENVLFEIFDRNGKRLYIGTLSFDNGKFMIDTESININQPGTYFIRITKRSDSYIQKFIKTN